MTGKGNISGAVINPEYEPAFLLTDEQDAIIRAPGNIRINAVAGSGKTATVIEYAASRPPKSKILYLVFNKSVKAEAKYRFAERGLRNVKVETAHSLAYWHIMSGGKYELAKNSYKTHTIAELLGIRSFGEKHGEFILANHIGKFLSYFCNSRAEKVQDLNYLDTVTDKDARQFVKQFYRTIEGGTRHLLAMMYKKEIPVIHDFYLKLFQLSKPELPYDYILFDEGQDASPAMLDVFLRQPATKVIVGDTHQQIYGWRHAVNSLEQVDFPRYVLSASFRFGPPIATLATQFLGWKKYLDREDAITITGLGKTEAIKTKATIARTNLGLLLEAIRFIDLNKKVKRIYFEGNLQSYTYAEEGASLYDVLHLYMDRKEKIRDKLIAAMKDIDELEEYIEKTEDMQLSMMLEIVRKYEDEIPALIQSLRTRHVADEDKDKAEMIFSTVHRAKGMEYDSVQLVGDFITEAKLEKAEEERKKDATVDQSRLNEEINMLYVAVTRVKKQLRITDSLLPKEAPRSADILVLRSRKEKDEDEDDDEERQPVRRTYQRREKGKEGGSSYLEKRKEYKQRFEPWTPARSKELIQLYQEGWSYKRLAKHFNSNPGIVIWKLNKLGVLEK